MAVVQISARFGINGEDPGMPVAVSSRGTITATLDNIAGVNNCVWAVVSTDETTQGSDYTLVVSGARHETVTFTAQAEGTCGILAATVNGGVDPQTGNVSEAMTAKTKWYVPTAAAGLEVGAIFETFESSQRYGSTKEINDAIRISGGAGVGSVGVTAPITNSGSAGNPVVGISPASGSTPGSQSVAHFNLVNNATDAATANQIGKRDANGDMSFRYLKARGVVLTDLGFSVASFFARKPALVNLSSTTGFSFDGLVASRFDVVLTVSNGSIVNPVNFPLGSDLELFIKQGPGAPHTNLTFDPARFFFASGVASALIATSAGDVDYYRFVCRESGFGGGTIHWVCLDHKKFAPP